MTIDVRGGSGGFGVGLDEVEAASRVLGAVAERVTAAAARVALAAADPQLAASIIHSPLTGIRAEAALVRACGPLGLSGQAAALSALGMAAGEAVTAYRVGESAVAASATVAQDAVMYCVGVHAPQVAVGVLTLSALGLDVGGLLDQAAFMEPGVADVAGGTPGLLVGLAENPLTAPVVAVAAAGQLGSPRDVPGAPADPESGAVRVLADGAALAGVLRDDGVARVAAEPLPRTGARAPTGVADLGWDAYELGDGEAYPAHVRVVEVPGVHGSAWLVEIPGTEVWDPHAGSNPFDVTSDVRLMARESTVLAEGVQEALAQAQGAAHRDTTREPVMLTGHSLGGIVAAGLASSPRFRAAHHVTHVVTMGSPVAGMPVPDSIRVLSLEHTQDPVPRLDGRANPDRRGWVTVTRDLRRDGYPLDRVTTASASHATMEYAETGAAVDLSADASLEDWRRSSRQFFQPAPQSVAIVRDYRIVRGEVGTGAGGP